jgi:hypothetical protein
MVDVRPYSPDGCDSRVVLSGLTLDELRALSRQHCFAGYSLVAPGQGPGEGQLEYIHHKLPVCSRHHAIDWNYHPDFLRSRPNKWLYDASHPEGTSFVEYGFSTHPKASLYTWNGGRGPGAGGGLSSTEEGAATAAGFAS